MWDWLFYRVPEVIQSTCNMATRDLSDLYALSPQACGPQALGIQIRQIPRAHVTTMFILIKNTLICTHVLIRYRAVTIILWLQVMLLVTIYIGTIIKPTHWNLLIVSHNQNQNHFSMNLLAYWCHVFHFSLWSHCS